MAQHRLFPVSSCHLSPVTSEVLVITQDLFTFYTLMSAKHTKRERGLDSLPKNLTHHACADFGDDAVVRQIRVNLGLTQEPF